MAYLLIILIGTAVVFAVMKMKKQRKLKKRQKMLSDELARLKQMNVDYDVKGYIQEEKKAMAYPENREILSTMRFNLVAAYINNNQCDEAIKTLRAIDLEALPLDFQILYHHNMLFALWFEDLSMFREQFAISWQLLQNHVDETQWKPVLKLIQVLNDLCLKDCEAAQEHIRQYPSPNSNHAASLTDMLWCELYLLNGQGGKVKHRLDQVDARQNFPLIEAWSKKLRCELKNKGLKSEETKGEVSE